MVDSSADVTDNTGHGTQLGEASAKRTPALTGRLAAGGLDVGAAMHRLVPGTWAAARVPVRVCEFAPAARAGRRATVRWSALNAGAVTRWTVSLRRVRTLSKRQARSAHAGIRRAGSHRWTVTGYSPAGKVVSASRGFRVVR